MIKVPAIFTVLVILFFPAHSQARRDLSDVVNVTDSNFHKELSFYPITRDTFNRYPDSLVVNGVVESFIISGGCGIICSSGAIKIKLSSRHPLYKEACVFVGVPCFEEMTDSLKNKQLWKLHKIPLDDNSCFWTEVSMNIYDSKGVPFYVTD